MALERRTVLAMTHYRADSLSFGSMLGDYLEVPLLSEIGSPSDMTADLPPAGPLRLGDVPLGSGRPVRGTPAPALWLTDDGVPDAGAAWRRLVDLFPETGLWPLLATPFEWAERPAEFDPAPVDDVDALDPEAVLAGQWAGWLVPMGEHPYVEHLWPYGATFPGLAPSSPRGGDPTSVSAGRFGGWGLRRIGLVRCDRPADAAAAIGWTGACNYCSAEEVSAVLRSWEDRLGVVVTELARSTLTVLVPHPPADETQALPIAAEMAALCPDVLSEDGPMGAFGYRSGGTVAGLARCLVRTPQWTLWWD